MLILYSILGYSESQRFSVVNCQRRQVSSSLAVESHSRIAVEWYMKTIYYIKNDLPNWHCIVP